MTDNMIGILVPIINMIIIAFNVLRKTYERVHKICGRTGLYEFGIGDLWLTVIHIES